MNVLTSTIQHPRAGLQSCWSGWSSGCLRCGCGLKTAELLWIVSMWCFSRQRAATSCARLACRLSLYLSLFSPLLSPPQVQQTLYSIDMIMYLGRKCAYIIVFMSACACVHHSVSYLEDKLVEHLTEDERIFFQGKRNKSDSKRYTAPLWGLQDYFLLSMDSTSPGKPSCDSTSCAWPISFIFMVLTITPHSQAIWYLPACADSIWTQLPSFAISLNSSFARELELSLLSFSLFLTIPPLPFSLPPTPPTEELPPSLPSPSPVQVGLSVPDREAQCSFVISRA